MNMTKPSKEKTNIENKPKDSKGDIIFLINDAVNVEWSYADYVNGKEVTIFPEDWGYELMYEILEEYREVGWEVFWFVFDPPDVSRKRNYFLFSNPKKSVSKRRN